MRGLRCITHNGAYRRVGGRVTRLPRTHCTRAQLRLPRSEHALGNTLQMEIPPQCSDVRMGEAAVIEDGECRFRVRYVCPLRVSVWH